MKTKQTLDLAINNATNVVELAAALNSLETATIASGRKLDEVIDLSSLPTFGEYLGDTSEIFSWDDKNFLVNDGNKWVSVNRNDY